MEKKLAKDVFLCNIVKPASQYSNEKDYHIIWRFALLTNLNSFSYAQALEDFKPSSVNQLGKAYPQVNSEGRVRAQLYAPEAKKVQLDIGGVKYDMIKMSKDFGRENQNVSKRVFIIIS